MVRRFSKRIERIKKILDILDEGRATFDTLLSEVGCGRATLSETLKMLRGQGTIKRYDDPKDSRVKWYEKVVVGPDDRVKAEKGRYASIEFIENLEKPVYSFATSKNGKPIVSVFLSPVKEEGRESSQKLANNIVKRYNWVLRLVGGGLWRGRKIAVVITLEG